MLVRNVDIYLLVLLLTCYENTDSAVSCERSGQPSRKWAGSVSDVETTERTPDNTAVDYDGNNEMTGG